MILNLHSLAFNTLTTSGGGNPAWGTEMGQGEGYRFSFENADEFITALVYKSIPNPQGRIYCPLGKGGNQSGDYEFVLGSLFEKIFVNGIKVDGKFLLLVVKKLTGVNHVGRKTLKYNPRMTLDGVNFNEACYNAMARAIGVSQSGSWFVSKIDVRNQDELHFTAHVLNENDITIFTDSGDRSKQLQAKLLAHAKVTNDPTLQTYAKQLSFDEPLQVIYYGAPGTGKSHTIDAQCPDDATIRTTFHPDTDYASFVGAYKPTMADVPINSIYGESVQFATGKNGHPGTENKIVYKFVPQAFLKAYVEAWRRIATCDPYFLVIEEINRGNCAQIFGDLFQLLDRNDQGASSYAITADEDITQYLANDSNGFAGFAADEKDAIRNFVLIKDSGEHIALGENILLGKKLLLPPNLYIWATMNTSDQSLFPIDSAFKRRWNWKYIPIDYTKKQWQIEVGGVRYLWADFLRKINPLIHTLTDSADKQMGYFFAKADKKASDESIENDLISEDIFLNKVLFYLWTDVLKDFDAGQEPFIDSETNTTYNFSDFFDPQKGKTEIAEFVSKLELTPVGNGESDVAKIAAEVADDAKGSRLAVTFPGETPMNDGKISDIYVATLERIGLDRVFNVLKERTRKLPLITKEKIETNDTARRYRQVGDYYILLGPDVYPYHPTLRILNDELSLGLNVQWDETSD